MHLVEKGHCAMPLGGIAQVANGAMSSSIE
jgi:hypothetical protein